MFTTKNSDVLLRPDIGLLLPLLTATNPTLLLLSTALVPLKWQSGCNCFPSLCKRKTTSLLQTYAILAMLIVAHEVGFAIPVYVPIALALLTPESIDTKLMKCIMMGCAQLPYGVVPAMLAMWFYLLITGYKLRLSDSYELLLSNEDWLLTRDARLAKRVNNLGDFHAEVKEKGLMRLFGDGRLVGKHVNEAKLDSFDKYNVKVIEIAQAKGRCIVDRDIVKIVAN